MPGQRKKNRSPLKNLSSNRKERRFYQGYIFAFQDIRGRYKSEGKFVMERPPRKSIDPKAIDESTNAYDTIEWMVKNIPHPNGRIGMVGDSYNALLVVTAAFEPHPALK